MVPLTEKGLVLLSFVPELTAVCLHTMLYNAELRRIVRESLWLANKKGKRKAVDGLDAAGSTASRKNKR